MKQTAVEKLIKGQQEIISNFKLNVEQQEKLTQLFDKCFELQKQQSLELIELTTQLTSVATAYWKVAEIECINIYNHYYNDVIIPKEEHKQKRMYSEEEVRKITLDFFYHWWNSKGTNTEQGFDKWFEKFKNK